MTCKWPFLYGAFGGAAVGSVVLVMTYPGLFYEYGWQSILWHIDYPMYLLQDWMIHEFDGTKIDALLVYILVFPLYWALLGFLAGLGFWIAFRHKCKTRP
jgi:hypothetical protein